MISDEIQLEGFKTIAAFPANTNTYDDASFDEPIEFLRGQKARRLWADIAENITPVTPMNGDLIAESLVNTALEKVLNDGVDIEKALKDAEKQIKRRVR